MSYTTWFLQNCSSRDVTERPFPYVVTERAFKEARYRALSNEFPDLDYLKSIQDRPIPRYSLKLNSPEGEAFLRGAPAWAACAQTLFSPSFLEESFDVFRSAVLEYYPGLLRRRRVFVEEETSSAWWRFLFRRTRYLREHLSVQAALNVAYDGYRVGPHTDHPGKLFSILVYFRDERDNVSTGGDLYVLAQRDPSVRRSYDRRHGEIDDTLSVAATVPYEGNRMCMMLNTAKSLHATSAYVGHGLPRRFLYVAVQAYGKFY